MLIVSMATSPLFGSQAPGAPDLAGLTTSVQNVGPSTNSALNSFITVNCLGCLIFDILSRVIYFMSYFSVIFLARIESPENTIATGQRQSRQFGP